LLSAARKLTDDRTVKIDQRAAALALLTREPDKLVNDLKKLADLLGPQTPPELQTAAVSALGRVRETQAREALIANWKGLGPARRAQIVEILLQRNEGAKALLEAIEKHQINANEIDAPARQRLLTHRVAEIRKSAEKAFAGSINSDRQKVIDSFKEALTLKGDVSKGREIFAKTCAACHKLNGVGNEVGPDLAALAGRTKDYLMIAILDPNRAVEARYVNYLAETKNGLSFAGVLLNETSTSITIVGPEGKSQTILRNNLESLTSTGRSAMPEGVEKDWQPQDLANLLAHLRASGSALKPRSFPNNKPELVQPETDGSLVLKASQAEIYGDNLVFEQQYRNLGYWARSEDFAAWSVRVPKAGKYVVEIDNACDNGAAGNTFAIETEGGTITGKVAGTGNWDTYRSARVGEITLPAGEQRVTMRSDGPIRGGAMIDLKAIRLKLAK
jgi:putative heme-binding domain-containing protein